MWGARTARTVVRDDRRAEARRWLAAAVGRAPPAARWREPRDAVRVEVALVVAAAAAALSGRARVVPVVARDADVLELPPPEK